MKSGIYAIVNRRNNKVYVGQSVDIQKRWKEHKKELASGTHHNSAMQRDYNNGDRFDYKVLSYCVDLDDQERFYINKYNSYYNGYNQTRGGSGNNPDPLNLQSRNTSTTFSSLNKKKLLKIILIISIIGILTISVFTFSLMQSNVNNPNIGEVIDIQTIEDSYSSGNLTYLTFITVKSNITWIPTPKSEFDNMYLWGNQTQLHLRSIEITYSDGTTEKINDVPQSNITSLNIGDEFQFKIPHNTNKPIIKLRAIVCDVITGLDTEESHSVGDLTYNTTSQVKEMNDIEKIGYSLLGGSVGFIYFVGAIIVAIIVIAIVIFLCKLPARGGYWFLYWRK